MSKEKSKIRGSDPVFLQDKTRPDPQPCLHLIKPKPVQKLFLIYFEKML